MLGLVLTRKGTAVPVTPHVHLSAVHAIAVLALVVALFGTAHLIALSHPDNRLGRALIALGF